MHAVNFASYMCEFLLSLVRKPNASVKDLQPLSDQPRSLDMLLSIPVSSI